MDYLEQEGYLRTNPQYRTLYPTAQAGDVLYRRKQVEMPVRVEAPRPAKTPDRRAFSGEKALSEHPELFERLKEVRIRLAREEDVPPYIIFSNASLRDMARRAPRTPAEFLEVSGVGEVKSARYGAPFLEAIRAYLGEKVEDTC